MGGQVLFQDALSARLELIKPSKADVEACLKKHPLKLTEGVRKVVEILHSRGTPVYLVSGGFRQVRYDVTSSIESHEIIRSNLLLLQLIFHISLF